MLKLCEMMAKKLTLIKKNKYGPWWLRWHNVQNPIGTSFDPCLKTMRSAEDRQREYYLRMERREDCSDDVIDGLAKLLEGDVIMCSAVDSDEKNDEFRSSHISLDPATISSLKVLPNRSFPASLTHKQIGASTTRDWQTHGPTTTFSTPVGPYMHGAMPTASTPILESLMHYIDRCIGEHQTYMKSMLANHEVSIMQKMQAKNKAIMQKIDSAMAMNKEACSDGVDVEFEHQFSPSVETKYNGMEADANIEYVKIHEGGPERARERETYQVHGRGCGRLRSGVVSGGWVSRKRLEGGVAAASRGEKEKERRERELVVESRLAEMRGDRERERPERKWRRGGRENGRRGHGGGDGLRRRVWRDESENVEGMKVFFL
ncbi:hypothetical protein TIFTF001_017055 [Ficus carica]|uniref:Uncharacterized protein n=1 Tax=Ficus carica TaxID=3494 RepID=A0AA88DAD6_FICCA|nr:hypothetical protein TIFTF001_017055 [Ficus carica]